MPYNNLSPPKDTEQHIQAPLREAHIFRMDSAEMPALEGRSAFVRACVRMPHRASCRRIHITLPYTFFSFISPLLLRNHAWEVREEEGGPGRSPAGQIPKQRRSMITCLQPSGPPSPLLIVGAPTHLRVLCRPSLSPDLVGTVFSSRLVRSEEQRKEISEQRLSQFMARTALEEGPCGPWTYVIS